MSIMNLLAYGGNSRMGAIGSSFASDISRRISQANGISTEAAQSAKTAQSAKAAEVEEVSPEAAEKAAQLQKLEKALGNTVAYMAGKHGEKAASAMIGMVYKRLGDGDINEQSLGNAFLDVTRFIDKNFGTDSGDEFMAHLNGNLNDSLNEFFDNGLNETFMVAPTGAEGGGVSVEGLLQQITEQYTDSVKSMLEEARKKGQEEQQQALDSPIAAYTNPWQENTMQGILKDVMV